MNGCSWIIFYTSEHCDTQSPYTPVKWGKPRAEFIWLENFSLAFRLSVFHVTLISVGCPVQLIREVFRDCICVDTHLPRFEALAYVLPHIDALTHVVIRVSSAFIFQTFAEVCYSVFVNRSSFWSFKSVLNFRKAYIFKSLLKVCYRSVFNESSKAFICQKCAESLHPE